MMTQTKPIDGRLRGPVLAPVALLRVSSVLLVGLMAGHMSAYPWASADDPQGVQLVRSMKAVAFGFLGERSTYWNLYFGWGLLVGVFLLAMALVLWLLSDIAPLAPRGVGLISALVAATSLAGACLAFRYFYLPPFVFFSILCVLLTVSAWRLLRQQGPPPL